MRLRIRVESLIVETFSVVLGVLLALAVNSWHERRVHEDSAQEALQGIRAEIAANRSALAAKLGYHEAMRDSLQALLARTKSGAADVDERSIRDWHGIAPARLVDNAWETASSTGVTQYMPYPVLLRLSSCYALQRGITDAQRAYYSVVYAQGFASGGRSSLASMSSFLSDLAVSERELAAQYDSALAMLTTRGDAAP